MKDWMAVGPEQLGDELREIAECPNCKHRHKILYGKEKQKDGTLVETKLLGFVHCPKSQKDYVVGLAGRYLK